MASETAPRTGARCNSCGFEAPTGSDEWNAVDHPPVGRMTQCPECGSTNVHTQE